MSAAERKSTSPFFAKTALFLLVFLSRQFLTPPALAFAEESAPYPSSLNAKSVLFWIQRHTNISPDDVVILGPSFIFAAKPHDGATTETGTIDLEVEEEVLTPAFARKMRARSAILELSVRCADRHIRTKSLKFYSAPGLRGAEEATHPNAAWREAPQGDFAAQLVASACDPDYRRPYAGQTFASATPPVDKPEPSRSPSKGAGPFFVQLGAYSNSKRANYVVDIARANAAHDQKISDKIVVKTLGAAILYLPYLGNFTSRSEAQSLCNRLKTEDIDCVIQSK